MHVGWNSSRFADVLRFLLAAGERGERTALVTITDVVGRASRAPGGHMAVSEGGAYLGSLSGGCVEAAVVGEAVRVIESGRAEVLRIGAGSPLIDVRLPCGGGMDLLIVPDPARDVLIRAQEMLQSRESFSLSISLEQDSTVEPGGSETGWQGDRFVVRHKPALRLLIVGQGAETQSLARLAAAYGAEIGVFTPDSGTVELVRAAGMEATQLTSAAEPPALEGDSWTALVMLFHDHDWETPLLRQALTQPFFFIGAMGSSTTHAERLGRLRAAGAAEVGLARLVGPIGLIPATRDPETLALSALAQVADHWGRRHGGD
jgi:xanthine dehydrogenase accessory factor